MGQLDYKRIPFEKISVKPAAPETPSKVNPQFKKGQTLGSPIAKALQTKKA